VRIQLLGTGSADGWPNPWCDCPSCEWARADPARVRGHTSALVDGTLLVDCGPDVPRTASRHGVSLAGVRTLLLTHAHPDHTGPAALLWRQWAQAGPLEIAGPEIALELCRDWAGADAPITWVPLAAGDRHTSESGHEVRSMAARHANDGSGPALLYAIDELLIGWDTAAPLPAEVHHHGPYSTVLIECTHGLEPGPGEHHTLADLETTVADLRRTGSVTAEARIVAVHLGHHNPPGPALAEVLAGFGVELHPDGAVLGRRRVLVTGGARSGKSRFAESLLAGRLPITYIATGGTRPGDEEWVSRVAEHQRRRPPTWRTEETLDVARHLSEPTVLVDCLTLWLTRSMFTESGDVLEPAAGPLLAALREATGTVVIVTNEVGSGVIPETASGRAFADALGSLNAAVAAECDEVWLCVAGVASRLR
jgi:adenosylcobinamide kinase/adenosylcobinamide-phosphate guanylyltransferase